MIRIRCADKKGTIMPLPKDAAFIELCDEEGNIAAVVSYDALTKSINLFDADSSKAERYKKFFNVNFIDKKYNVSDIYQQITNPKI